MSLTPGKYNSEPVYYCTNCLSLNVKAMGENSYCDDCGSTEMEQAQIEDWQDMYESLYGEGTTIKK